MTRHRRGIAFLILAPWLLALLAWGISGLPDFGHLRGASGDLISATAPTERHVRNVVASVMFDHRALDTLGEEFMLFAAVAGTTLLLRPQRGEREGTPEEGRRQVPETSSAVRATALGLIGITILLGIFIVLNGHLSPGGGFQGGIILATTWALVFLADEARTFRRLTPVAVLEAIESGTAGGFLVVGLAGLLSGAGFLANVLPLGRLGELVSGGTIPALNLVVGIEVGTAFALLFYEFLHQALILRGSARG